MIGDEVKAIEWLGTPNRALGGRAIRTVRSDSADVNMEPWLTLRVKVRCGMPSLFG